MKSGRELDIKIHSFIGGVTRAVPDYTKDITAAWLVVEHIRSMHPDGDIHIESLHGTWSVSACFKEGKWEEWTEAETAPHAICLAALKLMEGK